jgi:hypothetical protein
MVIVRKDRRLDHQRLHPIEQYIVNADAVLAATCEHSNGTATLNVYFNRGTGAVYPACWSKTGSPSRALSAIVEARSHGNK